MLLEWMVETPPESIGRLLTRVAEAAVRREGLSLQLMAAVLLTDDEDIRRRNLDTRGIDRATDVLSYPSVRYPAGTTARDNIARLKQELDPDAGCVHLGDIIISCEHARAQATEYGHSYARELGYLLAHGMLHLMGYDHETAEDRARMRTLEEAVMSDVSLSRAEQPSDDMLREAARGAMEMAYAPYSGFRVGACVLTSDGRMFTGCNVENASYGMTICAERNAMVHAIAEGARELRAIAIAGEKGLPYPCGACRQVLREFARGDVRVLLVSGKKKLDTTLEALLPMSFGPDNL